MIEFMTSDGKRYTISLSSNKRIVYNRVNVDGTTTFVVFTNDIGELEMLQELARYLLVKQQEGPSF